jgi:hypothetical protein
MIEKLPPFFHFKFFLVFSGACAKDARARHMVKAVNTTLLINIRLLV